MSNLPLSGSWMNRTPIKPDRNPTREITWKVERHPRASVIGMFREDIGFPAWIPIAYSEKANVLCSYGKKSEMRL